MAASEAAPLVPRQPVGRRPTHTAALAGLALAAAVLALHTLSAPVAPATAQKFWFFSGEWSTPARTEPLTEPMPGPNVTPAANDTNAIATAANITAANTTGLSGEPMANATPARMWREGHAIRSSNATTMGPLATSPGTAVLIAAVRERPAAVRNAGGAPAGAAPLAAMPPDFAAATAAIAALSSAVILSPRAAAAAAEAKAALGDAARPAMPPDFAAATAAIADLSAAVKLSPAAAAAAAEAQAALSLPVTGKFLFDAEPAAAAALTAAPHATVKVRPDPFTAHADMTSWHEAGYVTEAAGTDDEPVAEAGRADAAALDGHFLDGFVARLSASATDVVNETQLGNGTWPLAAAAAAAAQAAQAAANAQVDNVVEATVAVDGHWLDGLIGRLSDNATNETNGTNGGSGGLTLPVRYPDSKLKIPALVFCMSWCADFEFRVAQGQFVAEDVPGCGTLPPVFFMRGCGDPNCTGLAFIPAAKMCVGCIKGTIEPITPENVDGVSPPARWCSPDAGPAPDDDQVVFEQK